MTLIKKLALLSVVMCGVSACAAPADDTSSKAMSPVATVKPGANVSMTSALPKAMSSGSFQAVQLRFEEAYGSGPMSVKIEPSAGLSLFGGSTSKTFDMAQAGPHVWDIDVKSDVDGVYFLNVFAEAEGQPRTFSVQLNMGQTTQKMFDDAMPAEGELSDGGKIRVLEAEETIE